MAALPDPWTDPLPRMVSAKQVAEYLGITEDVLAAKTTIGEIPVRMLGRQRRYSVSTIKAYKAQERQRPVGTSHVLVGKLPDHAVHHFPARELADVLGITVDELKAIAPGLVGSGNWISTSRLVGRLAGATRRPIPPSVRDEVRRRDGRRCGYCLETVRRSEQIHLDHIVPVSKGGLNELANLTVACVPCNTAKGRKVGYRMECGHLSWEGRGDVCALCERLRASA